MSDPKCPAPEELSFEAALAELDQVVAALEGGQLELEESIVRYQRGVALLVSLQGKLADAQQKVTMLIGELETEAGDEQAPATIPTSAAPGEAEIPF
jgi:exodeoxyribonuclease VII small subunit